LGARDLRLDSELRRRQRPHGADGVAGHRLTPDAAAPFLSVTVHAAFVPSTHTRSAAFSNTQRPSSVRRASAVRHPLNGAHAVSAKQTPTHNFPIAFFLFPLFSVYR